jgi:Ca2+-binding EF-hand superfamily protein
MILRILCALGLLGFVLAPVQAADKAEQRQAKRDPAALFKKLNANSDSKLSKEEFKSGNLGGEKAEQLFDRLDADKDGAVSAEEFKKLADRRAAGRGDLGGQFKSLDANKDGKLSKEELGKAARLQDNPQRLDKVMQRLDANNDGSLSEDEFKKLAELRKKQPQN